MRSRSVFACVLVKRPRFDIHVQQQDQLQGMMKFMVLSFALFAVCLCKDDDFLYDQTGSRTFDGSVAKIELSLPVHFYSEKLTSMYAHSNGFITFDEKQVWSPVDFRDNKVLAPCMVEIQDYNSLGQISVLQSKKRAHLSKANADVFAHFVYHGDFMAKELVIVTWKGLLSTETTIQTVFIIGERQTFVEFLFKSSNSSFQQNYVTAQAGFSSGDRVRFTELLNFRAGRNLTYLFQNSNTMTAGKWMFQSGDKTAKYFQVKMPDTYVFYDRELGSFVRRDIDECSQEISACHPFADCLNTDPGYSCTCKSNYFGNGRVCLRKDTRVKLIGKVNGVVNNIAITDADFDAFITRDRGELYVSVGPVGPKAGYSLQMIPAVTGLLGWLFGASSSTKTGFDIVGNRFTVTSIIIFKTGEALHVSQQMKGFDSFNFLVFDTVIKGDMPVPLVQESSTHRFEQYSEKYVVIKNGNVYSDGSITYLLDGRPINYTVNRLLNYERTEKRQKYQAVVKVSNSIGSYYERSKLLRFRQRYSIGSSQGSSLETSLEPQTTSATITESKQPEPTKAASLKRSTAGSSIEQRISDAKGIATTKEILKEEGTTAQPTTAQQQQQTTLKSTCNGHVCSELAFCKNGNGRERCVCKEGYLGNGSICQVDTRVKCGSNRCDVNASCIREQSQNFCQCKKGFVGDGLKCKVDLPCNCHMDAECYTNGQGSKYCLCKLGFNGNGKKCRDINECKETKISCQSHSKCANSIGSYACVCDKGFRKNGSKCLDIPECTEQQDACGQGAVCTEIPGSYKCSCPKGFHFGNGQRNCFPNCPRCLNGGTCVGKFACKCAPGYSGNICQWVGDEFLLYSQGGNIKRFSYPYGPLSYGYIYRNPYHLIVGVDYDCQEKKVYWTDLTTKSIQRSAYDGSNMEILFRGLSDPQGLTIDWLGRNMYWTDTGVDQIEVASLNGKYRKTLFSSQLSKPRAIVCNPYSGQLFWTDWDRKKPRIEVSSMDGSGRKILVSRDIRLPNGLTIDYKSREICWTDAALQSLSCIGLDGRNQRTLSAKIGYPFGLTVRNSMIFWTNWKTDNIGKFNLAENKAEREVASGFGKDGRILDIKSVSACPARKNICSESNGGCSHFCLMRNDGGRTCACPDSSKDNSICLETN